MNSSAQFTKPHSVNSKLRKKSFLLKKSCISGDLH